MNSKASECFTTLSLTVFTQRNFVADFLLLRLRRYELVSVQNRRFCPNGGRLTLISGRRGRFHHSSFQKTRLNVISYGVKIWTDLSLVLSQCTCLTDGRTDGRTFHAAWKNATHIIAFVYLNQSSNCLVARCSSPGDCR